MKRLQSKGSLVKSIEKYYAKRHIKIKFSLAGEKKQYHLTFAEYFLDKHQSLDANICFTKTSIPCRMIFKKIKQ